MKIKSFYRQSRCEKIAVFEKLIFENGRHVALKNATDMFCSLLAAGTKQNAILSQISGFLKSEYEKLDRGFSYEREWYVQDTEKYQRALFFLQETFKEFVCAHVTTHFETTATFFDGSHALEGNVSLIAMDENGRYHAIIIHNGMCHRSMNGKSVHTLAATDLHCMVAKHCLEAKYPGIVVHPLYLSHKTDTPQELRSTLEVSDYASSNFHSLSYADYYDKDHGVFHYDMLSSLIESVIIEKTDEKCYGCSWAHLCKTPSLLDVCTKEVKPAEEAKAYQLPTYTKEQLEVVHHQHGPLCVCAGPGSGKTATVIGRIKYLIEECKVHPDFILVVTFTNEAAQELKNRCLSFLEESCLPKIATLNAFCYGILRENQDLLGKKLKLLSTDAKMRIVTNLLSPMPTLTGMGSTRMQGDDVYYATAASRLDQYLKLGEYAFFQKYTGLGQDFVHFAEQYKEIIECEDYITFDEQITLCNQLFLDFPDVLKMYSAVYQYVMVDEYQDVNEAQVTMLYSLCSHGNIVVVGDDDQSIYGFRGASAEFMIRFPEHFKTARTVILEDNFRSTKLLVNAAQKLIRNNKQRIEKDIRSGSGVEGVLPEVISSMDAESIDTLINRLVSEGYRYDDIAILSTKNAPLESLHSSLSTPSVLAKSYLREDGLFVFVYTVLQLFKDMNNDRAFLQYLTLFGKGDKVCQHSHMSLYEATCREYGIRDFRIEQDAFCGCCLEEEFSLLSDMFMLLANNPHIPLFLDICKDRINWSYSDSYNVLLEQIKQRGITGVGELLTYMNSVVIFQDETRVEVDTSDKVTLITCHDAKGKEFPVVLIRNDYSSFTEEVRRVLYVAFTRAKERLFILEDSSCKVNFLEEFPHTMEGLNE